jgi:hypothetical protein
MTALTVIMSESDPEYLPVLGTEYELSGMQQS